MGIHTRKLDMAPWEFPSWVDSRASSSFWLSYGMQIHWSQVSTNKLSGRPTSIQCPHCFPLFDDRSSAMACMWNPYPSSKTSSYATFPKALLGPSLN